MSKNIYKLSAGILCILFFVYIALRAHFLSLTCDESSTLNVVSALNPLDIWYKQEWFGSANNHVLNSALLRISVGLFGWHEWAIRLPNVLAYGLYLWACYEICNFISVHYWYRLAALVVLNISNFFLDFFSIARGYGLASALAMCALAIFITSAKPYKLLLVYSLLGLAILANYTYLNYFVAFVIFANLHYFLNENQVWNARIFKKLISINLLPFVFFIIIGLIIYIPLQHLMHADEFRWGASSLYKSFLDYAECFLYRKNNTIMGGNDKLHIIQFLILSTPLISLVFYFKSKNVSKFKKINIVLLACISLFLSMVLISVVQKHLLGTMYLDERKSIIYTPIICLMWVAIGAYIVEHNWRVAKLVFSICILFLFINFCSILNLKSCRQWWYDAGNKNTILFIKNQEKQSVSILLEWPFYWSVSMYNNLFFKNTFSEIATDNTVPASDTTFDYCFFTAANFYKIHPVYTPVYRSTYDGILFKKNYTNYAADLDSVLSIKFFENANADSVLVAKRKSEHWEEWLPLN